MKSRLRPLFLALCITLLSSAVLPGAALPSAGAETASPSVASLWWDILPDDAAFVTPIDVTGTDLESYRGAYETQLINRANALYQEIHQEFKTVDAFIESEERTKAFYEKEIESLHNERHANFINANTPYDFASLAFNGAYAFLTEGMTGLVQEAASSVLGKCVGMAQDQFGKSVEDLGKLLDIKVMSRDDFVYSQACYGANLYQMDDLKALMLTARANGGKFTNSDDAIMFIMAYQRNKIGRRTMQLAYDYRRERMNPDFLITLRDAAEVLEESALSIAAGIISTVFLGGNPGVGMYFGDSVKTVFKYMDFIATNYYDPVIQDWKNDLTAIRAETTWTFRYDYDEADALFREQKTVDGWVHLWRMQDHPENTLKFTHNSDASLHVEVFFEGAGRYAFDFSPDADKKSQGSFGDPDEGLFGSVFLSADGKRLTAYYSYPHLDPSHPLAPYIITIDENETWHGTEQTYILADDDAGQVLAQDDLLTIAYLGKQMNIIRDVTDVDAHYPVYRLSVTNHGKRDAVLRAGKADNEQEIGSVDGSKLSYLIVFADDGEDRPDDPVIPAGKTVEVILDLHGYGYGYRSVDELVNTIVYLNAESGGTKRDYTLCMNQGETYLRNPASGYVIHEAAPLGFTYEIPDDWEAVFSTDEGAVSSVPDEYVMNEGELLLLLAPPTSMLDGIEIHKAEVSLSDYVNVSESSLLLGGCPTIEYTTSTPGGPLYTHYVVEPRLDWTLEIIIPPHPANVDNVFHHFLESIRFVDDAAPEASEDLPKNVTRLPSGNLRYDDGLIAFEMPEDGFIWTFKGSTGGANNGSRYPENTTVYSVHVGLPSTDEYYDYIWTETQTPYDNIVTVGVAQFPADVDATEFVWADWAGSDHTGYMTIAGRTAKYYSVKDVFTEVSIPISGNRIIGFSYFKQSDALDLFLSTLEIYDSLYAEPPAEPPAAPTQAPTAAPTAAPDLSAWTGCWATRDESLAELIITDNVDGSLSARTMFMAFESAAAVLTPQADGTLRYEDKYGSLIGVLARQADGSLRLTFTGGYAMEDEEATEYQDYYARGFTYYPAAYEETWFCARDKGGSDDDWLGDWTVMNADCASTLHISRDGGELYLDITLGRFHFSGPLDKSSDTVMDLYGDDFSCMLVLNRNLKRIALMEVGSVYEEVYDLVGNPYYGIMLYESTLRLSLTPDEKDAIDNVDLPPSLILPVPTAVPPDELISGDNPGDYTEIWAHVWTRVDEPETQLIVTPNGDGTLRMEMYFYRMAGGIVVNFEPYDYVCIDFTDDTGEFSGIMYLNPKTDDYLHLRIDNAVWPEDDVFYDYFSEDFLFTTDDMPDLSRYVWDFVDGGNAEDDGYVSEEECMELFSLLSGLQFTASSGAGAWEGRLKINADGGFTGYYYDADAGDNVVYEVSFSGNFIPSGTEKWGDTTYALWVENLKTEQTPGTEAQSDYGDRIVYEEAPFYDRDYVLLTLPGTPDEEIPEMVRGEIGGTYWEWDDYSRFYTLTRDDGWGFFADPDDPPAYDLEPIPVAAPTAAPVPTAAPAGASTTLLPNGNLWYDYGLVAFEAPADSYALVAHLDDEGVSAFIRMPYREEYEVILRRIFPDKTEEILNGDVPMTIVNIYTTTLREDQDAQSTAWNRYDSPEYERDFTEIAGRMARRIRLKDASETDRPYITTEYDIPLTGNRLLSILIPSYADGSMKSEAELFLSTLEIRDSLYATPPEEQPAAPVPTAVPVTEAPAPTAVPVTETPAPTAVPVTETPAPTAVPVTETPAPTAVPVQLPDHAALLPNGHLYYDYGLIAFEAPADAEIVLSDLSAAEERLVTLRLQMPYKPEYSGVMARVYPNTVQLSSLSLPIVNVSTTQLDSSLDAVSAAWNAYNGANYQRDFVTVAGRTARRVRKLESGSQAYVSTGYLIPLSENRLLSISSVEYTDGTLKEELSLFFDTLEIRDSLYADPSGAANPTVTQAPAQSSPGDGASAPLPIPGYAGCMQVPVSSVDATSYIVGKNDPTAYAPFRMTDGEEATSFQFSLKTTPLGQEYLYFEFDSPVALDEMWMKNGFWRVTDGQDQYTRNCRVKEMTIAVRYSGSGAYRDLKTVTLRDDGRQKAWKVIDMLGITQVTGIRIRIDQVYHGSKFPNDVCISEIMFVQKTAGGY